MNKRDTIITFLYDKVILKGPGFVFLFLAVLVSFLGYQARNFKLDASAETLIIETDEDLKYSRLIESRYGSEDYLLVAFTPKDDLFSDKTLETLIRLRDDLLQLERVSSVVSILDVPLIESPPIPISDLATREYNLESGTADRSLSRVELGGSPIYRNLLVSPDLETTALQIKFRLDEAYQDLLNRNEHLREKKAQRPLTAAERAESAKIEEALDAHRARDKEARHRDIQAIRTIMKNYRGEGRLFLGGVSMIADDMISFIKSDLAIFGVGVALFLVITLSIIFRNRALVFLAMLCCALSSISMIGLLGMFGWKVTVISSNFISLQLIITMAISIHLIVRYREVLIIEPKARRKKLVLDTVRLMVTPCLYAALTTIAGFGSLVFCDILPVITFGWMMIGGIAVSLVLTFLLMPCGLVLMKKEVPAIRYELRFSVTSLLARLTESHGAIVLEISAVILLLSLFGISRLEVENSFINYFKDTTEIHRGMKVIDQDLGGTTPLDVIIELEESEAAPPRVTRSKKTSASDDVFDEFEEFDEPEDDVKYWFTSEKMALAAEIHDYLDSVPEIGKVLSMGTVMKIAKKLNKGEPLDNFQLAMVYTEVPDRFKDMLINPYVSPEHNELRFSTRVKDSEKTLRRNELLQRIRHHLISEMGLKEERVHLTGLLVLYNNMLQSLFNSQILTLGVVILALMGMFLVLFRSLKIALIALAPNLLAIGTVLGVMGWLDIPLDMMTITIAAISIGIGVDNTIHYIYRFKHEISVHGHYRQTITRCHGSIGHALFYTSVTIIVGFSILAASNFIPTISFGLLTGLAMSMALIASLTLLPHLLVIFKPFGPESPKNQHFDTSQECV